MVRLKEKIVLTRTELYQRVWSTPVVRLAREFGISDVALAKLCRRRNIPRPPRGYWARLASGQTLGRPPLPEPKPGELKLTILHPLAGPVAAPLSPRVVPARAWNGFHPIADRLRKSLLLSKPGPCGRVHVHQKGLPVVIASARQATKVARLVHELLAEAARKKIELVAGDGIANTLEFRRQQHAVHLLIEEELRAPAATQQDRPHVPSGRLTVRLTVQWKQTHDTSEAALVESLVTGIERVLT